MNAEKHDANSQLVNFFSPVDSSTFQEVVNHLKNDSVEVTFKIYDLHSKSTFVSIDGADLAILKKFPYDYEVTTVFCLFQYNENQLFFRSTLTTSEGYYLIKYPEKIYKVQRRKDFRFIIPMDLQHDVKIIEYPHLKCTLRDISLGGCKVNIRTTEDIDLVLESDLKVFIQILDFGGITIDTTVVFSKFFQTTNSQLIGLKFNSLDAEEISQLHQTLIKVDRITRGKTDEE